MSLSNAQYEAILREYENKQNTERHELQKRQAYVETQVEGYRALEEATASLSTDFTRRLIDGDRSARDELTHSMQELTRRKEALLRKNGLPADYLQMHYDCPDCHDSGYNGSKKCHCFEQRIISLLYSQSHIADVLKKENFDTLSYEYFKGQDLINYKRTVDICRRFVSQFDTVHRNLLFT